MYHNRQPRSQDIISMIVQAAEWWRAANIAAQTKEEKSAIKMQLKSVRKYIGLEIHNGVNVIDDHMDALKMERKKLIRLQTILNSDIEFAEDHISHMMTPYTDTYDAYYGRKTSVKRNQSSRKKNRGG